MDGGEKKLIEMAVQLAARLPTEMIDIVNRAILQSPGVSSPQARTRIAQDIPHPYYRDIANDFLNCWQKCAQQLSPKDVSLCLLTAGRSPISIAIGRRGFLEENLSGSAKAEARAGAVVE